MSIGKNWPQSSQFWLGFFVFGTPCICKQENLKELRTNPLRVLLWKAQPGKSQCCNFRKCQISAEKSFESYSEGPVCTERTKVKNNFEVERKIKTKKQFQNWIKLKNPKTMSKLDWKQMLLRVATFMLQQVKRAQIAAALALKIQCGACYKILFDCPTWAIILP